MATASVPIEIRGRYFWRGDERFLLRGVVYQDYNNRATGTSQSARPVNDGIADSRLDQLEHDIGLFKELDINAIFVFSIDNTQSHDKAMKMLEEAGIYVLAGLSTPHRSISRHDPYRSYTAENLSHFFKTADVLAAYPNCLGLIAANEIINNHQSVRSAPVLKAVIRDVKQYLRLKHEVTGQRILPVGYSAANVLDLEVFTRDYLSGGDKASRLDFWCKNDYSWCSPADMQISGYNRQVEKYSNFHIPAFFSEYGASVNAPRLFDETVAMLSPGMTHVFSGGFAYEFWRGANMYGIVNRATGKVATKWCRAQHRFVQISTESITRDMAAVSLEDYVAEEDEVERRIEFGTSRHLDRNVAEYRETSIGEILLYKDFFNLKKSLATAKDFDPHTDPDWTDSRVTAARAPAAPSETRLVNLSVDELAVPATCVDWAALEDSMRDGEYVLVNDEQQS